MHNIEKAIVPTKQKLCKESLKTSFTVVLYIAASIISKNNMHL